MWLVSVLLLVLLLFKIPARCAAARCNLFFLVSCQGGKCLKILIANRGEIACPWRRPPAAWGVKTVAVYSDADASAKHVAAVRRGRAHWRQRPKGQLPALGAHHRRGQGHRRAGHPPRLRLSERERGLRQACADAGLVFIGPPPSAIKAMGLKAESKRLMERPRCPGAGYHGADQDPALLQREADRIGYPVLIKASAGGGGKGMRRWTRPRISPAALESCKREAINSFGDDAVLIENTCSARATSRSRCLATRTATACTCSSATARCSAATRRCWKKRPPRHDARAARRDGRGRRGRRRAVATWARARWSSSSSSPGGYDGPEQMRSSSWR